jgi:NAD(P)H-hydrate epimerase
MIAGGSAGKTGAPLLAARGALRSGCGLVSLFAPRQLNPIFETALAEAMTIPLEQSMSSFHKDDLDSITRNLDQADCLVVGPGLGQDPATAELVLALYRNLPIPLVIDADALNILAKHRDDLGRPGGARILTPHPGEMARLLSTSSEEIQLDRVAAVRTYLDSLQTGREEHIVVLKGAGTIVAWNQNQYLNTTGNPGMATGGMGDVLSGLIGSLICQGLDLPISCSLGVFLHGFCADRLAERSGVGFTASEVADEIPAAVKYLEELR